MASQSIQSVLAIRNPTLTLNSSIGIGGVGSGRVSFSHSNISRWDDFSFGHIYSAYGHILCQPNSANIGIETFSLDRSFRNLSELKHYGFGSLLAKLESPLIEGARFLAQELGSPTAISIFKDVPLIVTHGNSAGYKPSLAFFVDAQPRFNLVVSCARLSGVWSSKDLEDQTENSTWPIGQLSNYAKFGGTRYSFIMTEVEVVVVRFYKMSSGELGAQWQTIPRNACGEGAMTVGLAIWCLVMVSLNREHRPITEQTMTLPINIWWKKGDNETGFIYEHHLSGRKLTLLPTGAVAVYKQV
ncbi:hypothetical protein ACHAPJ_001789 [Fusarium lateritium]